MDLFRFEAPKENPLMKTHIISFILIAIATIAFVLGFFVRDGLMTCCNIVVFVATTIAAVYEIILSYKSAKSYEVELKKRSVWRTLNQEEYDRLQKEGKVDADVFYAIYEDDEPSRQP